MSDKIFEERCRENALETPGPVPWIDTKKDEGYWEDINDVISWTRSSLEIWRTLCPSRRIYSIGTVHEQDKVQVRFSSVSLRPVRNNAFSASDLTVNALSRILNPVFPGHTLTTH